MKKIESLLFMEYADKVKAMIRFIATPLEEGAKPMDPTLYWKERVEEHGKIGELKVERESTRLKEEIPGKI